MSESREGEYSSTSGMMNLEGSDDSFKVETIIPNYSSYDSKVYESFKCYGKLRMFTENSYIFPTKTRTKKFHYDPPKTSLDVHNLENLVIWFRELHSIAILHRLSKEEVYRYLFLAVDPQEFLDLWNTLETKEVHNMLDLILITIRYYFTVDHFSAYLIILLSNNGYPPEDNKVQYDIFHLRCNIFYLISLAYNKMNSLTVSEYMFVFASILGIRIVEEFRRDNPWYLTSPLDRITNTLFIENQYSNNTIYKQDMNSMPYMIELNKREEKIRNAKCHCCGEIGHYKSDCNHKGDYCSNCNKKGHLVQVCRSDLNYKNKSNINNLTKNSKKNIIMETQNRCSKREKFNVLNESTEKKKQDADKKKEATHLRTEEKQEKKVVKTANKIIQTKKVVLETPNSHYQQVHDDYEQLKASITELQIQMKELLYVSFPQQSLKRQT